MDPITVFTNRTTVVQVALSYDVSSDTITSQIREGRSSDSAPIADWVVTKPNGGEDGELVLTMPYDTAKNITAKSGYFDLKRVSNGEPLPVFNVPFPVIFTECITE